MNNKRHSTNEQLSLDEINNTINFIIAVQIKEKFLSFLGPGLLVAVGYIILDGYPRKVARNMAILCYS
ncbi:hypothetical protein ACVXZY_06100 [Staphylococcus aureus]